MKTPIQEDPICQSKGNSRQHKTSAFTLPEFVCILAVVALLAAIVVPALAQGKPRSQQAICFNNLRMVGQAVLLFNEENGQTDPWRTPGAGYQHPLRNNAWFQFSLLSNGLVTPKVLACPGDALVKPAKDYSISPDGGFLNSSHQNSAISYFLGLDSSPLLPNSVLSGDRNIRHADLHSGCSSGISPAAAIFTFGYSITGWRTGLHGPPGNILLHDGRVEQTSNETVSRLFKTGSDDNGSVHLLLPRL